jgi:hypothetical protein
LPVRAAQLDSPAEACPVRAAQLDSPAEACPVRAAQLEPLTIDCLKHLTSIGRKIDRRRMYHMLMTLVRRFNDALSDGEKICYKQELELDSPKLCPEINYSKGFTEITRQYSTLLNYNGMFEYIILCTGAANDLSGRINIVHNVLDSGDIVLSGDVKDRFDDMIAEVKSFDDASITYLENKYSLSGLQDRLSLYTTYYNKIKHLVQFAILDVKSEEMFNDICFKSYIYATKEIFFDLLEYYLPPYFKYLLKIAEEYKTLEITRLLDVVNSHNEDVILAIIGDKKYKLPDNYRLNGRQDLFAKNNDFIIR